MLLLCTLPTAIIYRVAQKKPESMSNIHNTLNTCISSKCKSPLNNYWTNIKMYFIYQQLLALIIIYLMSLHSIKFVPKISLVSVSFWLVSVLFFFGPPCIMIGQIPFSHRNLTQLNISLFLKILFVITSEGSSIISSHVRDAW